MLLNILVILGIILFVTAVRNIILFKIGIRPYDLTIKPIKAALFESITLFIPVVMLGSYVGVTSSPILDTWVMWTILYLGWCLVCSALFKRSGE